MYVRSWKTRSMPVNLPLKNPGFKFVRDYRVKPVVWCDKHKLFQVLVNLLSNSKDALLEKQGERRVEIRVTEDADQFAIEVADNGMGISTQTMANLFRHGFSTKKHGHGFGLHSSANNAKALGGDLSVESGGVGLGATFRFLLPKHQKSKEDQDGTN